VQSGLPLLLLLTKSDKLKRGAAQNSLLKVRKELKDVAMLNVQLFSSQNQQGVDIARKQLEEWLLESDEDQTSETQETNDEP
jgi:GTP-binding protein